MLTLYYSPGACSLASHIALEEAGATYDSKFVALAKGEQHSDAYLKINPHARVPALDTGHGVLTENLAILTYIARQFPQAGLMPESPEGMARCLSRLAWFASSVHVAFAHIMRSGRYTGDESAAASVKSKGRETYSGYMKEIDSLLTGREYFLGQYSVADAYGVVFYNWGQRIELPMDELKSFTAHKNRMLARPAVKRALDQEGIRLA